MKTPSPVVQKPVVDALAFVLPWGTDCSTGEQARKVEPLLLRLAREIENGVCKRAYANSGRYRESSRIHFGTRHHAFVQIGAVRPDNQNGGIRISVNPARFIDDDVQHLHAVMQRIVGREYHKLLLRPLLNRIDFAVDVHHANLDQMLVNYQHAQLRTIFGKRVSTIGRIEGYNFGSASSDYMEVAYGKSGERVHAAIRNLLKNGNQSEALRENAIRRLKTARDSPDTMRVEVRGKKMRGLHLWELDALPNRFARFQFADLSQGGTELPEVLAAAFHALCQQRGVRATLELFKKTRQSNQVLKYWQSRQASWWQPESLWADACNALQEIGLFPDEAFTKPRVRNLARSSAPK